MQDSCVLFACAFGREGTEYDLKYPVVLVCGRHKRSTPILEALNPRFLMDAGGSIFCSIGRDSLAGLYFDTSSKVDLRAG